MPANWSYSLNAASVPLTVGGGNLGTIADLAFDAWNNEIGGAIHFSVKDTMISRAARDGQNIVAWGTAPSSALAITYIWIKSTGEVAELDTIMNQKYPWMWARAFNCAQKCGSSEICAYTNAYDAQSILTHEVGHWYGLDDEYDIANSDDTMYGYGDKWEAKGNTLEAGDIAGLKAIYQ